MIPFYLLDMLLYQSRLVIPCFFLLGFTLQKKLSMLELSCFFLLYDILLYQTYGMLTFLLLFLRYFFLYKKKKKFKTISFLLVWIFFFLGILFINKLSVLQLFQAKVITTFLIQFILFQLLNQKNKTLHEISKKF